MAAETKILPCSCNGTVAVEAARLPAFAQRDGWSVAAPARELCRREVGRFAAAVEGTADVVVTCTQESALFEEIARARQTVAPVRFVNIRERAGWGQQGAAAGAKMAALVAMAAAAKVEPVPAVGYASRGHLLIIGPMAEAAAWGERLAEALTVTVLATRSDGTALPAQRRFAILSGDRVNLTGWLGAFEARWELANPIDLDACVRCGACLAACPEQAIGEDFQVDVERCRGHRKCVAACGEVGAIDFTRAERTRAERFDLVLDLRDTPAFPQHDRPHGYLHPGRSEDARMRAALQLVSLVGEFEKPKYFRYNEKICAHGRNQVQGCTLCIEVCSTSAIASAGDRIRVEPHLCLGCGGCTTVCPSGALTYAMPTAAELGRRLRLGLRAYRERGGTGAVVLLHDAQTGRRWLDEVGRGPLSAPGTGPARVAPGVRGLPARVIPVEVNHMASVGIDVALAALAFGASGVVVLATGQEAHQYAVALEAQFDVAQAIVSALGYQGRHLRVLRAGDAVDLERQLHALPEAQAASEPATFALSDEKRRSIEFALEHLRAVRPEGGDAAPQHVALSTGAPFGTLKIDADRCTLCKACIGACPEGALLDNPEIPQLRFVERNCVQCGLCVKTCPEKAITLEPRYTFGEESRSLRVLNEAQPFHCVSCGKPFGTRQMIDSMVGRLSTHSMFGGDAIRRLQMCADCRVADMFSRKDELTIHDVPRKG